MLVMKKTSKSTTISHMQKICKTYVIVTGKFNDKRRSRQENDTEYIWRYGLRLRNHKGEAMINYLNRQKLFCLNWLFKKPNDRKWNRCSPGGRARNVVDFILCNHKNFVEDISVINQFNRGSNHRQGVISKWE